MLRRHLRLTPIALFIRPSSSLSLELTMQKAKDSNTPAMLRDHKLASVTTPAQITVLNIMASSTLFTTDDDVKLFLNQMKAHQISASDELVSALTRCSKLICVKTTAIQLFEVISSFFYPLRSLAREKLVSPEFCVGLMELQRFADDIKSTRIFLTAMHDVCVGSNSLKVHFTKPEAFAKDYARLVDHIEDSLTLMKWLKPVETKTFLLKFNPSDAAVFLDQKWKDAIFKAGSLVKNCARATTVYLRTLESLFLRNTLTHHYADEKFQRIAEDSYRAFPSHAMIARLFLHTMNQVLYVQLTLRERGNVDSRLIIQASEVVLKLLVSTKSPAPTMISAALLFGLATIEHIHVFVKKHESDLLYLFRLASQCPDLTISSLWRALQWVMHAPPSFGADGRALSQRFTQHFAHCDFIHRLILVPTSGTNAALYSSRTLHYLATDDAFARSLLSNVYRDAIVNLFDFSFAKCGIALPWLISVLDRCIFMDTKYNHNSVFSSAEIGSTIIRLLAHPAVKKERHMMVVLRSIRTLFMAGSDDQIKLQLCQSPDFHNSLVSILEHHIESKDFSKQAMLALPDLLKAYDKMNPGSFLESLKKRTVQLIKKHDFEVSDDEKSIMICNVLKKMKVY